ncbi:hypothetical protein PybrP1_012076 [[Pythium] brassicae (nom. inval.)]|nr:hypothetical protein PybrP1_012076 [[Pythium] brassicae (nom. inval.)]
MELERKHLLLLFALGVASKGFVKSTLGANASLVLLLSVALYYWRARRRGETVYDDIARRQAEAAAKIDQLHGIGDGTVSEMDLHVRKTQFRLRPDDASIITDRMHKYSRKFSGSLAERRKFLAKRKPRGTEEDDGKLPSSGETRATAALPPRSKKSALESAVEAAVDDTL